MQSHQTSRAQRRVFERAASAVVLGTTLTLAACGGGARQSWTFAPVQSNGVSLSTENVIVRPQSVSVRIRVVNQTPMRVAINFRNVTLSLPDGTTIRPSDSLAARIRVEQSGGVGGIQYAPPGRGVFRIDFARGPVDYTTVPSMQLDLGPVLLVTQVMEQRFREGGAWGRTQDVAGVSLAVPPLTLVPPVAPTGTAVVVASGPPPVAQPVSEAQPAPAAPILESSPSASATATGTVTASP